jgi:oxygen-independent coproporphyrinogen-3 oxidase
VYTNKNASEVEQYLDLLAREWDLLRQQPALAGRSVDFVYFGGGTPSFLSTQQLSSLVDRLTAETPWTSAEEITFECEPGTITEAKLDQIRRLGVTRLSLGVENFDDHILEVNGRAHRSPEIARSFAYARSIGFPQINIDLIAGMLGETDDKWRLSVERTLALEPDSVTIYQMELPYNTTITADILKGSGQFNEHVAPWETRRRWVREAFEALEAAGYSIGSAYTAVRTPTARNLSTAIGSGRARTLRRWVSHPSATSTASTSRTSTRGKRMARRSIAASCRSAGRTVRHQTSG